VVWIAMLTVNSPLLALYRVKEFSASPDSVPYYFCGLRDHLRHGPPLFISFFTFTYIVPLSIIVTMYLLIVRYLDTSTTTACMRISTFFVIGTERFSLMLFFLLLKRVRCIC